VNDFIPYNCDVSPQSLASAVQQNGFKLPYSTYFGGVVAINLQHVLIINGLPNRSIFTIINIVQQLNVIDL
jgi:hypothetical protein